MKEDSVKRLEKILLRAFLILGLTAIAGIILLIRSDQKEFTLSDVQVEKETEANEYDWEAGLSDSTLWLPDQCSLYEKIPDFAFYDESGEKFRISDFEGKPTVVVFWASWCNDCQEQMPYMNEYMTAAEQYGDIQFLFINKTDGEKETIESADIYIREQQLAIDSYYDTDAQAYDILGLHNIPTTIFLSPEGIIKAWSPNQIKEQGVFEALTQNMIAGSGAVTAAFIIENMMNENGGVHSLYDKNANAVKRSEILSESQGAMLEYAALVKDKELFDKVLSYIENQMLKNDLISWTVSEKGASDVNALIDDLRIYSSLLEAQELWGDYQEVIAQYEQILLEYGINREKYVDFYDSENKTYASRFTLCYGDLRTMEKLAMQEEAFQQAYSKAEEIVTGGQISNEFPLYYSWYNYEKDRYEKDELNAAEAMMVLLHLAEADKLPPNTVKWLKARLQGDGVKARYTVEGKTAPGYNYDSTAVYALIVMIANEIEDEELRGLAFRKMEKMHITDITLPYNGAFGLEDGTGITSFDQIMPMLAYVYSETRKDK